MRWEQFSAPSLDLDFRIQAVSLWRLKVGTKISLRQPLTASCHSEVFKESHPSISLLPSWEEFIRMFLGQFLEELLKAHALPSPDQPWTSRTCFCHWRPHDAAVLVDMESSVQGLHALQRGTDYNVFCPSLGASAWCAIRMLWVGAEAGQRMKKAQHVLSSIFNTIQHNSTQTYINYI